MKKYTGYIPLIATTCIEFEAENDEDAMDKLLQLYDEGAIDLLGFDNEDNGKWWVEEDKKFR